MFYDAQSFSVKHEAFEFAACSDMEEEYYIGYDEEEVVHVDFKQKRGVATLPDFAGSITFPGFYEIGADAIVGCKRDLPGFINIFKSLPLEMGKSWECAVNFYIFIVLNDTLMVYKGFP